MGTADVVRRRWGRPERQVVQAAGTGALVDLRVRAAELDDPADGASWAHGRTVPAGLLVELLTDVRVPADGRLRAVRLRGARITGLLDLEAVELACPLLLWDCHLEQPINLTDARAPAIRLPGCHVPGLAAEQLETRGNLELDQGFTTTGEVGLVGARIGGKLRLSGARLSNPKGWALVADRLIVDRGMFCREGFTVTGEMRLVEARIGGVLELSGAHLSNPNGPALVADALSVDHSLFCGDGFTAVGHVSLSLIGARIGGRLELDGARLCSSHWWALVANGLSVDQGMFCREGFTAIGGLSLEGARIGGVLDLSGAHLSNPDEWVLGLEGVQATELLLLPRPRPEGIVDLTNAHVGRFHDEQATWPEKNMLLVRGFVYETLENDKVSVRDRIGWVRRHEGDYTPQPYEQLAAAYRRAGREDAARQVAVAKQWHRRSALRLPGKLWNWLLYVTVGYGYRTWLAALWLVGLLMVGSAVFASAYPADMVQAKRPAPAFNPVVYTLDRLVPVVNLGQRDAWIPQGAALRWSWVLTGAGWVLTTAVVAGLTAVLKRD